MSYSSSGPFCWFVAFKQYWNGLSPFSAETEVPGRRFRSVQPWFCTKAYQIFHIQQLWLSSFWWIWVIFLDSNVYLLTCCLCQYSTISLKDLHPINFLCSTSLIHNLHNLAVVCEHGISLSSNVRRTASATVTVSTIFLDLTHF